MASRLRKSIWELNDEEVQNLKTAYEGIMQLPYIPLDAKPPAERLKGYFNLASVHGVFDQRCFHGALQFVFWHRIYMRYFEDALREIVPSVTLPYFDAGAIYLKIQEARNSGQPDPPVLPEWCTKEPFIFYPLPDDLKKQFYDFDYTPRGSSTSIPVKRYFEQLGFNWNDGVVYRDPTLSAWFDEGTAEEIIDQLNQAVSATTVEDFAGKGFLENPHGSIHVMTGTQKNTAGGDALVPGWIGKVPIASFDPIFWFHHSNIERHFKIWQERNNVKTREALDAMSHTPGFSIPWNQRFAPEFDFGMIDAVWEDDVEYTPGFGYQHPVTALVGAASGNRIHAVSDRRTINVTGIDRTKIEGSFYFFVHFHTPEKTYSIRQSFFQTGVGCQNCQENPFLSLRRVVPAAVSFPCEVSFSARLLNGTELSSFGEPTFNIRFAINHQD